MQRLAATRFHTSPATRATNAEPRPLDWTLADRAATIPAPVRIDPSSGRARFPAGRPSGRV